MSLEQIIAANTEAVAAQTATLNTFIALLQKSASTVQSVMASEGTTTSDVLANDKTEAQTEKKTTKTKAAKTETKADPVVEKGNATSEGELTYADIAPLVIAVAKIDRAKAVELLGTFGAKSAKELASDQYADFKVAAEKVLNPEVETEDDLV